MVAALLARLQCYILIITLEIIQILSRTLRLLRINFLTIKFLNFLRLQFNQIFPNIVIICTTNILKYYFWCILINDCYVRKKFFFLVSRFYKDLSSHFYNNLAIKMILSILFVLFHLSYARLTVNDRTFKSINVKFHCYHIKTLIFIF